MASVKREEKKEKKSATTGVTGAGRRSSPFINVKVKNQENGEVFFRIRRSAQLRKLMTTYCEHHCIDTDSIAFLFDGTRIKAEHTPDELEMKDGDEIDAMPRISFQEAKRRKKEEAEWKVKKLDYIAEKQRQMERELEEQKVKLEKVAEEQRQRERELEERKAKLDKIAEEQRQKEKELEEQRKVKKLVCPDIFTAENELKSWCVQNGRSITPSAFKAIAHCIVGYRGGINPAEDIPKMMLGWDARGDQILFGVKNTSTAMQEVLKGFTTIHANMEMMIEGQQRTQTTAPLPGHHE